MFKDMINDNGKRRNEEHQLKKEKNEFMKLKYDLDDQMYKMRTRELEILEQQERRKEESDHFTLRREQSFAYHKLRYELNWSADRILKHHPYLKEYVDSKEQKE